MSKKRNMPCDLGRGMGATLAAMADEAQPEYAAAFSREGLPVPQRCSTCAFRAGTHPNGCLATTADATKCVMEYDDFLCHDKDAATPEGQQVCVGWAMVVSKRLKEGKPKLEVFWKYSDEYTEEENRAAGMVAKEQP